MSLLNSINLIIDVVLNDDNVDILLIIIDIINTQPKKYFFALLLLFKPLRELEKLRNGCDTAESFHKIKHLTEALQYHEKLEELQKAFETAKELVQQYLDEVQKQHESQDDPAQGA